jgi:hypothetical protein
MTPSEAIASLDAQLVLHGDPIILRRYTATSGDPRPKTDLPMNAFVRPAKPEELVGDLDEKQSIVSVSPTDFAPMWPLVKGDKAVIAGKECNINNPGPVRIRGVLVRCNLVVAG